MRIGLGAVQFGLSYGVSNSTGLVPLNEIKKVLNVAKHHGVQIIDTATGYGISEKNLGKCLDLEHEFSIVTKTLPLDVTHIGHLEATHVRKTFEASLELLGQKAIYGLLVHQAADLLNPGGEKIYNLLLELKRERFVKKIGVSVYEKDEIDSLLDRYSLDIFQVPINVFDQRLVKSGSLQRMNDAGIEVHARSAFLQGILLMKSDELPQYFNPLRSWHKNYVETLDYAGIPKVAAALGFLNEFAEIKHAIVGVVTAEQLIECASAVSHEVKIDFSSFAFDNVEMLDPRNWV